MLLSGLTVNLPCSIVGKMMSEDEFVVLVEHAGLVDSFDESDVEFIERYQLLEWLDREGFELFRQRMNGTNDFRLFHNEVEEPVAELMVLYLLERKWISAVETEQIDEVCGCATIRC